ncbi:MAG: DUF5329 domain-containing protein [Acidobacteriota bacterium]|nr:DUF5329 domain-containing protein [Acidobacteriota bacterium]
MKRRRALLAVLLLAALPGVGAAATRPPAEQKKIDWLIEKIGQSKATFIRNGTGYDAAKAVSHLKFKLFMAGSRVQTVKDFIEGVASSSSETGKPYFIRMPGAAAPMPMHDWLTTKLADYDKSQRGPPTPTPARAL